MPKSSTVPLTICITLLFLGISQGMPVKVSDGTSACRELTPKACVEHAMDAMGGRAKLEAIHSLELDVIGHTALMEQSYRQAPFITSYERDRITVDFSGGRMAEVQHSVWPESDPGQAESDATLITTPQGGAYGLTQNSPPCSAADLDSAKETLALGPERLLLTAAAATDLHFEPDETLRSTPHTVVAFQWHSTPVRILLSPFTQLPDAVETVRQFHDFWYFWGDVRQRVYWDNWKLLHGIVYPTNQITERNGTLLSSMQVLDLDVNKPLDEKRFDIDPKVAQRSMQSPGWDRAFGPDHAKELAPGVTLFAGSWNATIIEQADGVVILETPISSTFTEGLVAQAKKMYPNEAVKAVLTTSDSWPHVGGVRYDVAQGLPTYVLDLNRPLLERMLASPHTIQPDALQLHPRKPDFRVVSEKTQVGSGDNRVVLYPLRGASTERQYMVYFPGHRLLYASDTLVLNADGTLYDPELLKEVEQAVSREHLDVDTVFAMHQAPVAWNKVIELLRKAKG